MKNLKYIVIVILIFMLGCTQKDSISVCNFEPMKTTILEEEFNRLFYVTVHHNNETVNKMVITEEYSSEYECPNELQSIIDGFEITFSEDVFDYKGINLEYELEKKFVTIWVVIDFKKLDLSIVNEDLIEYIGGTHVVDENYNVLYEELINSLVEMGFTCE